MRFPFSAFGQIYVTTLIDRFTSDVCKALIINFPLVIVKTNTLYSMRPYLAVLYTAITTFRKY